MEQPLTQEQYVVLLEKYLPQSVHENERFWKRLGGVPPFKDSVVLDVGCGLGFLCIDMAKMGAKKVVGIDIEPKHIAFARQNLKLNHPELIDKVDFLLAYLNECPKDMKFDFIISKDSFEHILDLKGTLDEMVMRLKVGGSMYIGFAPLWHSPLGDHQRTRMIVPWGHLLVSEKNLIKKLNRKSETKISSLRDLGLNLLPVEEYIRILSECGLVPIYLGLNVSDHPLSKIMSAMAKIPVLKKYFTHSIYCILKKVD